jgi:SPP1 gp7 family putative phage head morphogenesis protein
MLIAPKARVQYPMALEREYAKELKRYVHEVYGIINEYLDYMVAEALLHGMQVDARQDSWLSNVTDKIKEAIDGTLPIRQKISAMFDKVRIFAKRQQERIFRSIFGAEPVRGNNRQYEMLKTIWVSQNLTLIESIDRQALEAIHYTLGQNIIRTVDKEMLVQELKETIKHAAHVSENRAALIATDQVGKLNSQLAQYEQMAQGAKQYLWQSMHDNRVRPKHRAPFRDGNIYHWGDPPPGGHPGWPIRCRCVAKPVYDTEKIGVEPKRGSYENAREN